MGQLSSRMRAFVIRVFILKQRYVFMKRYSVDET